MKAIILSILMFSALFLQAQEEFSFKLFAQDAAGNKDSLIFGVDPAATIGIDPAFGEVDIIGMPWNNTLDMRISSYHAPSPYSEYINFGDVPFAQTKKQIINDSCSSNGWIFFEIHTNHHPVAVWWDSAQFADNCRLNSFIGNEPTSGDIGEKIPLHEFNSWPWNQTPGDPMRMDYINNIEIKIACIRFANSGFYFLGIVENNNNPLFSIIGGNVVQDELRILNNTQQEASCVIYSTLGKEVLKTEIFPGEQKIDVSSLKPGFYFISDGEGRGNIRFVME